MRAVREQELYCAESQAGFSMTRPVLALALEKLRKMEARYENEEKYDSTWN